jgi:hypothetical protein
MPARPAFARKRDHAMRFNPGASIIPGSDAPKTRGCKTTPSIRSGAEAATLAIRLRASDHTGRALAECGRRLDALMREKSE